MNDPEDQVHFTARIVNFRYSTHPKGWRPPVDMIETGDEVIIRMEIAGMHENDFHIFFEKEELSISGSRTMESADGAFHQMEIGYGPFSESIDLPILVDQNKIEAVYKNGFLTVTLQKKQPHHIDIQETK